MAVAKSFSLDNTTRSTSVPVCVAEGDGIGPEIMRATLRILDAAGAQIEAVPITVGEQVYLNGHTSGIDDATWDVLRKHRVLLKAPITTPQGKGVKSLNVTLRKTLGLYANIRPVVTYHPFVRTSHPGIDMVIVRENEEDLYAGIEHRQTDEVYQCLKIVSRPGCERIVRHAFELARAENRKRVTCMTKDNIMKLTDGLFHKVFNEIGKEYPEIKQDHMIIDIGAARVATDPNRFDVIVTPNLYGDILSDIAAQVAGSVGIAPSANIGNEFALFEAIHGSAPDIAGKDIANPTGLLLASVMMLVHIGQPDAAAKIHNAWLRTIEQGVHTADLFNPLSTVSQVGTQAFADAVIANLGKVPEQIPPVSYALMKPVEVRATEARTPDVKKPVGIDVFVQWTGSADTLADRLKANEEGELTLKIITNRGVKVWPNGLPETTCTDHWRCRFTAANTTQKEIIALLARLDAEGLEIVKTEGLFEFNGEPGYSLGQGQ